ncbi:thioredoxin domain-containing protein [Candidatus Woesebacteria bacterium]|nr:thioredoxin domain-containing protein [Candidatus Woesebacteria bacterium]
MAKTTKRQTPKKTSTRTVKKTTPVEQANHEKGQDAFMDRLSKQFNIVMALVVVLLLFQGYTYFRLMTLEKKGVSGTQEQESALSQDNLVAYAKELGLDEKKFEQCLTNEDTKDTVDAEQAEGTQLGIQGTPGFFVNGKLLAGAFPIEFFKEIIDKELDGTGSAVCADYSEQLQQYCSDPQNLAFNPEPAQINLGNSPMQGTANAPVTIVEFSDFQCPYCARAYSTVKQIQEMYGDKVKVVYKQFPLTQIHPDAMRAAQASLCARDQGKFWELHDKMFEAQGA